MHPSAHLTTDVLAGKIKKVSPTDVTQFVRLDQCRRYLRLQLHERLAGARFMSDYDVNEQPIPAMLTRSGAKFEQTVEQEIRAHLPAFDLGADRRRGQNDNTRLVDIAGALQPGEPVVLFQPRLDVELSGWQLRGDVDVLRLERDENGLLHLLIADVKSSDAAKVEHRLQVAFYHRMLSTLLSDSDLSIANIDLAVLYRGSHHPEITDGATDPDDDAKRADAAATFGVSSALLERVDDVKSYLDAVDDLVLGDRSIAAQVSETPFESLPYHLTYKCDWCPFNEFCMKWSAEHDDLSLVPHLAETEKSALQRAGVTTTSQLANLKDLHRVDGRPPELTPIPATEPLVRTLASTWPVGPRLDELIYRAKRYRRLKGDQIETLPYIPSKGYGSLPYSDAAHNPNLIRIYLDAQHDITHDRIYLLGALVVASEAGAEPPHRRRAIVRMTDGPPDSHEREEALFLAWVAEVLRTVVELASPDEQGQARAPIHLIFYNRFDQQLFLEGLGRHATAVLGATPLYDFATQLAAYDSPIATFLVDEIRELKNYPMVCQSLSQVAAHLRFDWNAPEPFRELFHFRHFDFWAKFAEDERPTSEESLWFTGRSRFDSQIPTEYAYGAWGELGDPVGDGQALDRFRRITPELLTAFETRRLEALEWIAKDFSGNRYTEKRSFDLPDLADFDEKAKTLAQALDEFVTIERHVELGAWKAIRHASPERRLLSGETLIGRYEEADQDPGVAAQNRENKRRQRSYDELRVAYFAANPAAKQFRRSKEQRAATDWSQHSLRVRLRFDLTDCDCDLDEALALTTLRVGDRVVVNRRRMTDSRKPIADQEPFTPTPKKMLYGTRAEITAIVVERGQGDRAQSGYVELTMDHRSGGGASGFLFGAITEPFDAATVYTIDPDPNSIYGFWCKKVTEGLAAGGDNTLYDRLAGLPPPESTWPAEAVEGQARFLQGLVALRAEGAIHDFEPSKHNLIAGHGGTPTLLVQGPPGTGKSYTTAFALFARLQGAMAAGVPFRAVVSCKTHAATDVLLKNLTEVQHDLRRFRLRLPKIFTAHFDDRLLDLPLYRIFPRGDTPDGVIPLRRKGQRLPDASPPADVIAGQPWSVTAATPGGIYSLIKERWSDSLFGHEFVDCLVLDEASQMNLPEAIMAALPLKPDGRLIVVGDHRQMPPIVHHDWLTEPHRTFKEFRTYQSLFLALTESNPPLPMIQFSESFRLHADMAEFLRREVYQRDGIAYHSNKRDILEAITHDDPFVAAVLDPTFPIVVVVHDEANSQVRNQFEQILIAPVLEALADERGCRLGPRDGLGVVVPHRAQRAAVQEAVPCLTIRDPRTGIVTLSAVDTVERFQGDERTVIMVSATESDPRYLLASSKFLLDPRRLTVALSRAKRKMILVAARSVFDLFSADDETFVNAQLWKNLLRRTCTVPLWSGARDGYTVEVWGNETYVPLADLNVSVSASATAEPLTITP